MLTYVAKEEEEEEIEGRKHISPLYLYAQSGLDRLSIRKRSTNNNVTL